MLVIKGSKDQHSHMKQKVLVKQHDGLSFFLIYLLDLDLDFMIVNILHVQHYFV